MRFHTRKWVKPEDLNANGTKSHLRVIQLNQEITISSNWKSIEYK